MNNAVVHQCEILKERHEKYLIYENETLYMSKIGRYFKTASRFCSFCGEKIHIEKQVADVPKFNHVKKIKVNIDTLCDKKLGNLFLLLGVMEDE